MSKIINMKTLQKKRFKYIENLSEQWNDSMGKVDEHFIMIIWGNSANGKTSFTMSLANDFSQIGLTLYVSLEEGHTLSLQSNVMRHISPDNKNIRFADHKMTYEALIEYLNKKRSPKIIIIDSLQYWAIDYRKYQILKERFPNKSFVFVSHANGKLPDGKTASKIMYDAGIKIRVDRFIAFVRSRYGGNKNYLIWEEGAKKFWKKDFKKHLNR